MTARLTELSRVDAFAVAEWYDGQTTGVGDQFLAALDRLVDVLARYPRLYGRVRRGLRGREIRQSLVGKFPFLATYEVTDTEVVILSVSHARSVRQPWRQRLP